VIRTCLFPLRMNRLADGRGSQDERDLYMSATVPPLHEPNRSGKDAFRRVSNSFWKYGDAVERVPTRFRRFNVRIFRRISLGSIAVRKFERKRPFNVAADRNVRAPRFGQHALNRGAIVGGPSGTELKRRRFNILRYYNLSG
jgi:hypothetical protein